MNRSCITLPCLLLLACVALASFTSSRAEEAPDSKIAALAWMAGDWVGTMGGTRFEALYTDPAGGTILSTSKHFRGDAVGFFEFERFVEQDGEVVLVPYPAGRASVEFRLVDFDPAVRRARFVNPEHDFPQELTYALDDDGVFRIVLTGERRGAPSRLEVELRRR